MDLRSAFLNGKLQEERYFAQTDGLVANGQRKKCDSATRGIIWTATSNACVERVSLQNAVCIEVPQEKVWLVTPHEDLNEWESDHSCEICVRLAYLCKRKRNTTAALQAQLGSGRATGTRGAHQVLDNVREAWWNGRAYTYLKQSTDRLNYVFIQTNWC